MFAIYYRFVPYFIYSLDAIIKFCSMLDFQWVIGLMSVLVDLVPMLTTFLVYFLLISLEVAIRLIS